MSEEEDNNLLTEELPAGSLDQDTFNENLKGAKKGKKKAANGQESSGKEDDSKEDTEE